MSDLSKIKEPILAELKDFNRFFSNEISSTTSVLNIITKYILKQKGKQLRPILVFLAAKLVGEINKSTKSAALLIELMHTATLIHDDVVDIAYKRRSYFSLNALWKNKIAVLIGDYFLAKGLLHAVNNKEFELLEVVSEAVREMSEGELLQIEKARMLNIDRESYFEIITKKTAVLISSALEAGACSAGASVEQRAKLKELGIYIGIAFQIKDDIFDYEGVSGIIGKPTGNDIKEQKITLPLIYILEQASDTERNNILRTVKKHHNDPEKVKWLVKKVISEGGIKHATEVMIDYRNKALNILNDFKEQSCYESMKQLLNYITERKK